VLEAEFDRLHAEIDEKDRSLRDLLRRHNEQIEKAQQDAAHNSALIEYLNETKQALSQLVKQGQNELKTTKEDKKTFKSALDVIVRNDSRLKTTFLKRNVILQRKIALEKNKSSALEKTLERKSRDYEEKIQSLSQEKLELEQRVTQLHDSAIQEKALYEQRMTDIVNLRQQIDNAQLAHEDQRSQFKRRERDRIALHHAKVTEMTREIDNMKDKIQHLEESLQRASAPPPLVSSPKTFNNVFIHFAKINLPKIIIIIDYIFSIYNRFR